jgi:hypothetical protein
VATSPPRHHKSRSARTLRLSPQRKTPRARCRYFRDSPGATKEDKTELVPLFTEYALRAYKYANALTPAEIPPKGSQKETCSRSPAVDNCVGVACNATGTMGPCALPAGLCLRCARAVRCAAAGACVP